MVLKCFGNRYAFRIYEDQVSVIGDLGTLHLYEAGGIPLADLGSHWRRGTAPYTCEGF